MLTKLPMSGNAAVRIKRANSKLTRVFSNTVLFGVVLSSCFCSAFSQPLSITSGNDACEIVDGFCVQTVQSSADTYENDKTCNIRVGTNGKLSVKRFDVEKGDEDGPCNYDSLTVQTVKYCAVSGPQDLLVSTGDTLDWLTDDEEVETGFKICLVYERPSVCAATTGAVKNAASCACGWSDCTAQTGLFCTSVSNKCSTTAALPACTETDGKVKNNNACKCAAVDCTTETGLFCTSANNKCRATAAKLWCGSGGGGGGVVATAKNPGPAAPGFHEYYIPEGRTCSHGANIDITAIQTNTYTLFGEGTGATINVQALSSDFLFTAGIKNGKQYKPTLILQKLTIYGNKNSMGCIKVVYNALVQLSDLIIHGFTLNGRDDEEGKGGDGGDSCNETPPKRHHGGALYATGPVRPGVTTPAGVGAQITITPGSVVEIKKNSKRERDRARV